MTGTGHWSIEVTFQEVRAYLGVETTRGWIERTVLRAEPCLFGLDSVVALWYAALPERDRHNLEPTWTGKTTITFSDAITPVRRELWSRWISATPAFKLVMQKLTPPTKTPTHPHANTDPVTAKAELRGRIRPLESLVQGSPDRSEAVKK